MDIQKLNINISKLDKIFHIADIHIRLFKRRDEYLGVFNNLYDELLKRKNENSIIVIAGDIVHGKIEMSPELVDMTSDLFNNLGNIMPTIITAGNHDLNLNNKIRLDAISPIIKAINNKNIFYLKKTGLYEIGNTILSVMSVFDEYDEYIKADFIESNNKIAIYHGTVNNAVTDTGWKVTNEKINTNFFDGYDIVLLGDIHKRQVLQRHTILNNITKPAIEYPGSLIQQNYGESLDEHGLLIWDCERKTNEFIKIKNKFGYLTIDINAGKIESELTNIPEKPRFRLKVTNTKQSELKECISKLRKEFSPIEVSINRIGLTESSINEHDKIDLAHIRDVDFQNTLLSDYIKRNFNVDDNTLKIIFDINRELNSKLPVVEIVRNVVWKPKLFKFDNMFSYGQGNIIDFSKMNGLVGLFSSNASGKTSVIESLMFCLFDKCTKAFKSSHILNNRKDYFMCEFVFDIDGEDYTIKRVAKKSSNGDVKVKVDFYKTLADGNEVSLNGEQRRDTNSIIRSYIGNLEDFILTAVSSQTNPANFIDKTQSERKDLLYSFMDISIFDQLHDIGTDEMKEYQVLLKDYKKNDYESQIEEMDSKIKIYKNEYSLLEISNKSLNDEASKLDSEVLELTKQLIKIDLSITNIDALQNKKKSLESLRDVKNEEIKNFEKSLNDLNESLLKIDEKKKELEADDIKNKYLEFINIKNKYKDLSNEIDLFVLKIQQKKEKTENLRKLEYDENCKYCMNNIFVKDAIKAKNELENDKKTYSEYLISKKSIEKDIELYGDIENKYEKYNKVVELYNSINLKLASAISTKSQSEMKILSINEELKSVENDIIKYYQVKEDIESNKKVNLLISEVNLKISKLQSEIIKSNKELRESYSQIIFYEDKKKQIIDAINKFKEMEEKYASYQYYIQSIHRDALPYELLSKAIPNIEQEANNILSQMVDFAIMLDLDGKNINGRIVYDTDKIWPLELASGMERFISSLVLRVALINITSLPRPNFIAIDEGFGTLDSDNSSNLPMMLDYLKTQFDFLFLISHMDSIRDYVDMSLNLKKDSDDFSKIVFN